MLGQGMILVGCRLRLEWLRHLVLRPGLCDNLRWQQKTITKGGINGGVRYDQLMLNGENAMRIDGKACFLRQLQRLHGLRPGSVGIGMFCDVGATIFQRCRNHYGATTRMARRLQFQTIIMTIKCYR